MRLKIQNLFVPQNNIGFIPNICFILENILFVHLSFGPIISMYFFLLFISNEKKTQNERGQHVIN